MSGKTARSASAPTQKDYQALARLRLALRQFSAFSAEAAQAAGLPAQQHQALLSIKGNPEETPMTMGALARSLLITPHAATELVDRLAESGLVLRQADPADRRRLMLVLSAKAENILRSLSLVHLREIRGAIPALMAILEELEGR